MLAGVIVVFVTPNLVSSRTVNLAAKFIRKDTDELHLVTSVVGDQHIPSADDFVRNFNTEGLRTKAVVHYKVLARGRGKVQVEIIKAKVERGLGHDSDARLHQSS